MPLPDGPGPELRINLPGSAWHASSALRAALSALEARWSASAEPHRRAVEGFGGDPTEARPWLPDWAHDLPVWDAFAIAAGSRSPHDAPPSYYRALAGALRRAQGFPRVVQDPRVLAEVGRAFLGREAYGQPVGVKVPAA